MATRTNIFRRGPASIGTLTLLVLIGLILIVVSTFTNLLVPARAFFVDLIAPFYQITDVTSAVSDWSDDNFASRERILAERDRYRDENLILQRRVMTMASLQAENARLRQLLSASELVEERVLIAELVGTPPDTEIHRMVVNRGRIDGVAEGQPVVDATGLIGQISIVGEENSEVILISDREHALPVQILRNGLRAIAEGMGNYRSLRLRNVPPTMDIKEGDRIVSSGLGQRFPRGYPVGRVVGVEASNSTPFLEIRIEPSAGLETSRQLLLLFSDKQEINSVEPTPPDSSTQPAS